MKGAGNIKILFVAGFGPIVRDKAESRKLYGEVVLPFGLLRVGRQPVNRGTGAGLSTGLPTPRQQSPIQHLRSTP
jgi:hypothetical protein